MTFDSLLFTEKDLIKTCKKTLNSDFWLLFKLLKYGNTIQKVTSKNI